MEASLSVTTERVIVLKMSESEAKQLDALLEKCSQLDADAMMNTEYTEPPFEKFNDITFKLKMAFISNRIKGG